MDTDDNEQKQVASYPRSEDESPSNVSPREKHPRTEPNAGTGDPTDGRKPYDWETRYPRQAVIHIRLESLYLLVVFFSSLFIIFAAWKGWLSVFLSLSGTEAPILKKYAYYAASGMLGGVVFGIKYFYRVVARGYWHLDRRIWRLKSPLIAMSVAFVVGAMIDASFISTRGSMSSAAVISIGFLAGYFADDAVGKMYEIASVIFGKSAATKAGDGK